MEVIEVTEREVEIIEVIERGPQGPAGAGLSTLTTQGDTLYQGETTGQRLPIGTAGQVLRVNSGATAPEWATISSAPAAHAASHATGGTDAIAPNQISAAWQEVVSSQQISANVLLSAGRNRRIIIDSYASANIDLPASGNQAGDRITFVAGVIFSAPTIRIPFPVDTWTASRTLTAAGQSYTYVSTGGQYGWSLVPVGTHSHAASDITSGTLAIDRIPTGTSSSTVCIGNDSRLSDSRTPTAHAASHASTGSDPLFDQDLNTTDAVQFESVTVADLFTGALEAIGSGGNFTRVLGNGGLEFGGTNAASARTNLGLAIGTDVAAASHTHNTSDITSGVFDNARINFAAPTAIGSTTRNTGAFTTLNANNGTITASAPVLDLEQTWNNAAVAFTGVRFNAVRTAASDSSLLLSLTVGGANRFGFFDSNTTGAPRLNFGGGGFTTNIRTRTAAGVGLNFDGIVGIATTLQFGVGSTTGAGDVSLTRDSAANTLAQGNGTNAQTFRLYNTSANSNADFERGFMRWSSNVLQIGTEKAGTGSARALEFQTDGVTRIGITANGANCDIGSVLRPSSGNTFDLGGNGRRWNNLYVNTRIFFGDNTSAADPSLKKSSTSLQVRLADDSAFAPLSCGALTLNGNLDASTRDIVTDTTTGTKIGTGTTQKLGFFNATPVTQRAAIADATDAATTQARLNDLLAAMRSLGLIAT